MPEEVQPQREKILTEVLLEIRFNGAPDLSLLVGKMDSALHAQYPKFLNLNVPDFPAGIPNFDAIVKYRMLSEDSSKLYNLGRGVLSINTINYTSFANFISDAKIVLEKYKEISNIDTLSRIGLRYINKIAINEREFNDLFRIQFNIPESLKSIEASFNYQSTGKINSDILATRFYTEQPLSKDSVFLDFDYYCEQNTNYTLDTIESWATNAKNTIVQNFKNCLTEDYYQALTT
jgi:uncharacterized protein (TIGR04255 family)